jgi:cysteine desulfurase
MKSVYFDSAATTAIDPEVKEAMIAAMDSYGNPSSTHNIGRKSKIIIERVRKGIAQQLNCQPGEIFFTSGGTEADNMAILCAVRDLGVTRIISSPIEHHAVGHTAEFLRDHNNVELIYLEVDELGQPDLDQLESLLKEDTPTLVSLMHANNELGNILDIERVGAMCRENNAWFHSDTVQTVGHRPIDLETLPEDFITCAAHKIHGPKGAGFLYVRSSVKIHSMIMGGGQERSMRAGTENIIGIAGLGKAIELAYKNLDHDRAYMLDLKKYAVERVQKDFPFISFNGLSADPEKSLFTVLSLRLPKNDKTDLILFSLDMKGIGVSGGSACNSGSSKGSHVIEAINKNNESLVSLRLSFSKYNTKEELDYFFECLAQILEMELENA